MHASISTWRLSEPLREEAAYSAFLEQLMDQNVALALEVGLLDAMIIRIAPDTVISIGIYEDEAAAQAAIQRTATVREERYAGVIELLDRKMGRADDIPQLTGRGD